MSKFQLKHIIKSEIARINDEIDRKIVKGVSYKREAQRHKMLLNQLNRISSNFFPSSVLRFTSFL